MRPPALSRLAASAVAALALSAMPWLGRLHAQNDGDERRSTWERNASLTFYRYFEPFPRVESARACRDRCVHDHRCTGWTYYDASFKDAGLYSFKLQRVCVLGAGLIDRQSGNRPGRTSGVVRTGPPGNGE
ncbi:MAG TPA: hypothetical protein VFZ16_14465 [Hyphomicrobiaceae bacterium]|nr:hypothetical protein [Hyphomicrobiaceae bacterium]